MKITTIGIDLAKNVFQVHGVDERGNAVLRKQLRRAQVAFQHEHVIAHSILTLPPVPLRA